MARYIPDSTTGYEADLDNLIEAARGNYVMTGLAVSAQASPNMTVKLTAGTFQYTGVGNIGLTASLAIAAADPTNARVDLVVINSGGVISAVTGTPSATPKPPALPASSILLALISVAAAASNIQNSNISDRRIILGGILPYSSIGPANNPDNVGQTWIDSTTGSLKRWNSGLYWESVSVEMPNLVPNSDFGRRTLFNNAMCESFPDTGGYHKIDVGVVPTVAANILTFGAANNEISWPKGAAADGGEPSAWVWRDGRISATFKVTSTTGIYALRWRIDASNYVEAAFGRSANEFRLSKTVAGTPTTLVGAAGTLTINRWVWVELEKQGTTFIAKWYDTGLTTPGTVKSGATLQTTATATIADAGLQIGAHLSITSDQAAAQWGGIVGGNGGVYVETGLPEGFSTGFDGALGGQAIGFSEAADSGPIGKQWNIRLFIPAAASARRIIMTGPVGSDGSLRPSTAYTFSGYYKVTSKSGAGQLALARLYEENSAQSLDINHDLGAADATSWTRDTSVFTSGVNERRFGIYIYGNPNVTASLGGTIEYDLFQLEEGSAATAWRNSPADSAPWTAARAATLNANTSTSTTDVEIDARDAAMNVFFPKDSTAWVEFKFDIAGSVAGDLYAVSIYMDGAAAADGAAQIAVSINTNGYLIPVLARVPVSVTAGKHRFAARWRRVVGTGTMSIGGYTYARLSVTAQAGK